MRKGGSWDGSAYSPGSGLAVVGGLVVSQLLTLYITPVIYVYMDRFATRARQRQAATDHGHAGEPIMAK